MSADADQCDGDATGEVAAGKGKEVCCQLSPPGKALAWYLERCIDTTERLVVFKGMWLVAARYYSGACNLTSYRRSSLVTV